MLLAGLRLVQFFHSAALAPLPSSHATLLFLLRLCFLMMCPLRIVYGEES